MSKRTAIVAHNIGEENMNRLREKFSQIDFHLCLDQESFAEVAPTAEIVFSKQVFADAIRSAEKLRWVQTGTAGIERWLDLGLDKRDIRLSNASGVHGIPMSEVILSMMLAFATGLHTLVRGLHNDGGVKQSQVKKQVLAEKFELEGQTVCVLGLGDIGGTLAKKCHRLGMEVVGVRRNRKPVDYVDKVFTMEERAEAIALADHVALCLPLTPETVGIVGPAELRAMRRSAYIYNVGRGASIEAQALLQALREGNIAGAGLDVTDPEPLPADSPLWSMPNVLLSLHTSGDSPQNSDRITDRFIENLERYLADEPLIAEIDPERGY